MNLPRTPSMYYNLSRMHSRTAHTAKGDSDMNRNAWRPITGRRLHDWYNGMFNGAPETGVLVTVVALAILAAMVLS
jgi:hypothetical protein